MKISKFISNTAKSLNHSEIDRIFEMASKIDDVVVLAMGQPDFDTPDNVCEAGIKAIREKKTKYTDDLGIKELRDTISGYVYRKYSIKYNPINEIIALAGVSNALDTAIRAIVNPGDEVIIHQPSYNSYVPCVLLAGGIPIIIDTYEKEEYKLSAKRLQAAITPRTKALILSYPNNPTGAVMTKDDLVKIAEIVEAADIMVISDEIYSEMMYEDEFTSFAALPAMKERTIVINGVTKSYSMPGWRLGYACGAPEIIDAMLKIHQYIMVNAPSISQYAAIEALKNSDDYIEEKALIYDERRRYIIDRFEKMELKCFAPKGAFYVFPSIKETGLSSKEFCDRLLSEGKVAAVPGYEFGECGEGYIRCSYTLPLEKIEVAMNRIEKFMESFKNN